MSILLNCGAIRRLSRGLGLVILGFLLGLPSLGTSASGNRLTYLDQADPFQVGLDFPKLTTPQWVGEEGVEAVVILAIDDMRDPAKYETFLRPILDRLKRIDQRAPVSIFVNAVDPANSQLQTWLQEGLSLEVHTLSHPCPCLARGDFAAAADTYHGCVDLLNHIPGNRPVAFRMPCCDSMNSPSPRFYAEIFESVNPAGQFLTADSSVMNILTAEDPSLPRALVVDEDGRERFRKYLPRETNAMTRVSMGSFATTIENYPYPYVLGKLAWEFPAMVPSDWEAQNLQGSNQPRTVEDWKAALDATVLKQGVFTFIFHPHGWIRNGQLVEFIDYATQRYGRKVKFLNFREAQERIDHHLLAGHPLRDPRGRDQGVRLLDVDGDGFMDVVVGNESKKLTRRWQADRRSWAESDFPVALVRSEAEGMVTETGGRFGVIREDDHASFLIRNGREAGVWHFEEDGWVSDAGGLTGLVIEGQPVVTQRDGRDLGVRLRDVDADGRCELLVGGSPGSAAFTWSREKSVWQRLSYALPEGVSIVDANGRDHGVRFVDLNGDGHDDLVYSNEENWGVYLFLDKAVPGWRWEVGWSRKIRAGVRGEPGEIPPIVRGGAHPNNGAWFHSDHLWVQNEDTAGLPDRVDRRSFPQLIAFDAPHPLSPEEARGSFRLRPGFEIELVAAEPMVLDPVAFDWGADGALWVVEMGDYPEGLDGQGRPGGIVRVLRDTDGDGRYDQSKVFLSDLNFPNGIMPWRGGVLISAAPEIIYAEDTNGDDRADKRQTLFRGFGEGNQQHRVNGFDYGLDNWVYGANGDSGGVISGGRLEQPVNLRGHDFRFRPDTGQFELVEGQTQFGRHRDDWGNWFGNNNPTWLWHFVLPERYVRRNPHLPIKTTRRVLANYENSERAFAVSPTVQRFNWPDMVNTVTSANSPTPYRDDLFGPDFLGSVFASEPANNLIHREVLEPEGVTFRSRRPQGEEDREFIASTDNWFRPTMMRTGPDGALYIADMYRLVIEHPGYALEDMRRQIDLRAGDDRGRIWRVFQEGRRPREFRRLDHLKPAELVEALDSPNGWQRDTAQRLLVQAGAKKESVAPLQRFVASHPRPLTRLHALATLDGLGAVTEEMVTMALQDSHPLVRVQAIRISEPWISPGKARAEDPVRLRLQEALRQLAGDDDIRVRYQLAFSLGECEADSAGEALARIALRDSNDPWMQTAVLSSSPRHIQALLATLLWESAGDRGEGLMEFVEKLLQLAVALDRRDVVEQALRGLVQRIHDEDSLLVNRRAVAALLDALDRKGLPLDTYFRGENGRPGDGNDLLRPFADEARARVLDPHLAEEARMAMIDILGYMAQANPADLAKLGELLRARWTVEVQRSALAGLTRQSGPEPGRIMLSSWSLVGPAMRTELLNALTGRKEWLDLLLENLESGRIAPGQIGAAYQQRILTESDAGLRQRAQKIFATIHQDRQQVIRAYASVPELKPDLARGAELFRQNCATCHRFKNEGVVVGPDLAALMERPVAFFIEAILDPNRSVEAPYVNYTAVTGNGLEVSGIIASESGNSLVLRASGGAEHVLLRAELASLTSSGLSVMPEGFENSLPPQAMADLIGYLVSH